jgi:hypothetical protein
MSPFTVTCAVCSFRLLPLKTQDLSVGFNSRALTVGKQMGSSTEFVRVEAK